MSIDESKLNEFLGKMVSDMGAAAVAPLVLIGDKLGLYRALAEHGPMTTQSLASHTGTTERYIREWCAAQAGSGYIRYNADGHLFDMSPEQQAVFADSDSPACMIGGYYALGSLFIDEPKITSAFQTGEGVGWGEHNSCLFCGTEKFFRPGYEANLVSEWLPSMDGLIEKLQRGAKVADVGCGHGVSTLIMAKAFPNSEFIGFDFHGPSVERAQQLADDSGLRICDMKSRQPKRSPETNTTWSSSLIACTTWETRSELLPTRDRR